MTDFTFQKASKQRVKARFAIDGPSGSGKTYTALVAATALSDKGKIAVIDTEHGSASLYSDAFNFDVLELDNYHPDNYVKAIEIAERQGYDVIVIDSLSHAWEGEGGALDLADEAAKRQKTPNSYTAWKEVTPLHRKMVDAILNSPSHIIATMRSKMDYVQEKDGNGRTVIRKVGMAPIQRAGMEYEFTLVGDMDLDHTIVISKSRCPQLADAVERKPGKEFFTIFKQWLENGSAPAKVTTVRASVPMTPIAPPKKSPAQIEKRDIFEEAESLPIEVVNDSKPSGFESQTDSQMTFEEACLVTNSRNQLYGDLDSNILKYMSGSLYKALKDPQLAQNDRADYQRKLTAIDVILKNR
jgi:hypothetical protein